MDFEEIGIYVELDSLLDTRLSALYNIDPKRIDAVLADGYHVRISDEFVGYDKNEFDLVYRERGKRCLIKDALLTGVRDFINAFTSMTLRALVDSPFCRQPKLYLNIHPYVIPEETIGLMITSIAALTKNQLDIEVIDLPREEVTPSYAKRKFACMVIYDYWNWLEIHSLNENLKHTHLPAVTLIGPAIVKSMDVAKSLNGVDYFDAVEKLTGPFIKLKLYPASKFSADVSKAMQMKKED